MQGNGEVTIKTADEHGGNVISITLKVKDGKIENMSAKGPGGSTLFVHKIKFSLGKHQASDDNDECRCCFKDATGHTICVTCSC